MIMELNAQFLNKFGPSFFIVICLSTGFYGTVFAMPKLYESQSLLLSMQMVACFGMFQLFICWFITKAVDSSYHPDKPFPFLKSGSDTKSVHFKGSKASRKNNAKDENGRNTFSLSSEREKAKSRSPAVYCDALSFHINVITADKYGRLEKKGFPYWTWVPCYKCQFLRPPRCHHCPLCHKCVLKRDHHCFFTGTCIGVKNQGHFIVFSFWDVFVTTFGTIHMLPFTYLEIWPTVSFVDFLPPFCVMRVILGYTSYVVPLLILLFWSLLILTVLSIITFHDILRVTIKGCTLFEIANKIKVTDCRSPSKRWHDALGTNWPLPFLFPFMIREADSEDALSWPHIKI